MPSEVTINAIADGIQVLQMIGLFQLGVMIAFFLMELGYILKN